MRAKITLTIEIESDLDHAAAKNSLQHFGIALKDLARRKMESMDGGSVEMSFEELPENVRADWSDGMR